MATKATKVTTTVNGVPHTTTVKTSTPGSSSSSSGTSYNPATVAALNAARAAVAAKGGDTTAGNLKNYDTFAASQGTGATTSTTAPTTSTTGDQKTYTGQDGNLYYEGSSGQRAPDTADSIYRKYLSQSQGTIDALNGTYDAEVAASQKTGAETESSNNASLAASGLLGSSAAVQSTGAASRNTTLDVNKINSERASKIADVMTNLRANAQTQANTERTMADTEAQQKYENKNTDTQQALQHVQSLAQAETNWDNFKKTPEYSTLLQQAGGDANYLDAVYTLSKPQGTVDTNLSKVIGNTYYQVTKDPVTGEMKSSSFELPYKVPTSWTFQKIGTNSGIFFDPNTYNPSDPSTYKMVYTDPFTGAVTDGSSTPGSESANSTGGSAARNVQSILGVDDMSQPLSQAVQTYGADRIAAAMVQNEGGSPAGVDNNPGNIKYMGLPGQTDSGVKATDGGTFASYKTPEDGLKSIADIIAKAASGKSAAYGEAPTLAGFIGKYTNTGTTAPSSTQYGILSTVSDFNPQNPVDSAASNYLNEYLSQGKIPTAASVGISTRTGSGAAFNTIADRANALYTAATGQSLPDATQLATNKKLISGNNSILNNLNIQEGTIGANVSLLINNLNGANLNENAPAINKVIDSIKNSLGNADTASLFAQSSTIQNELGSLLALKNASGTTVHDKLEAAGLIDKSYNADQIAAVVKTLMSEAQNGRAALNIVNAKLYQQTDPLQKNSNNPLKDPTSFFTGVGIDLAALKKDNPGVSDQDLVTAFLSQH